MVTLHLRLSSKRSSSSNCWTNLQSFCRWLELSMKNTWLVLDIKKMWLGLRLKTLRLGSDSYRMASLPLNASQLSHNFWAFLTLPCLGDVDKVCIACFLVRLYNDKPKLASQQKTTTINVKTPASLLQCLEFIKRCVCWYSTRSFLSISNSIKVAETSM